MISKAKQLASITAVGAGAVVLTSQTAEASIVDSNVLNTSIQFTSDTFSDFHTFGTHVFDSLVGGPNFGVRLRTASSSRFASIFNGAHDTHFDVRQQGGGYDISIFAAGATWNAVTGKATSGWIGLRNSPLATTFGQPAFTDKYLLFEFSGNSGPEYGWIQASLSVTKTTQQNASFGPNVTIIQYAFDGTGAKIHAGDTGVPEPSTSAEAGIAALILGAEGLRRWRKARKAATATGR